MASGQELWEAIRRRYPDAVRLGGVCYLRLKGGSLAKAELTSGMGGYSGLQLTVLNPRSGPVDSLTIPSWDLPRVDPGMGEDAAWDIYRPTLDIDALTEIAEKYLRLFDESDAETR